MVLILTTTKWKKLKRAKKSFGKSIRICSKTKLRKLLSLLVLK
jgi:hypothetical protein